MTHDQNTAAYYQMLVAEGAPVLSDFDAWKARKAENDAYALACKMGSDVARNLK